MKLSTVHYGIFVVLKINQAATLMKCLIIDDDLITCRILRDFIEKTPGIELAGTFGSPVEVVNQHELMDEVELIFLDVEMPEMTGFDFISNMDVPPTIIMISSKENYAVDAFTVSVADFMLKPISYSRFLRSIRRVRPLANVQHVQIDNDKFDGFFLRKNNSYFRVKYSDIVWLESVDNYVQVITPSERYIVHLTLKMVQARIPSGRFLRTHRSFIVNIDHVRSFDEQYICLLLNNETVRLPVGRTYKNIIMKEMNVI